MRNYTKRFFAIRESKALQSAGEIVPIIMDYINPASVVDIGCGNGTWLSVFAKHNVSDLLGVDGGYVDSENLLIPLEQFTAFDLSKDFTIEKRFDLAMSLEVAEHIPTDKSKQFVAMLTRLSDVVMFSAAVPGQGGVDHINEQWQSYWANIFKQFEYVPVDFVREMVWSNPNVRYWYKQNILIYCKESALEELSTISTSSKNILDIVHPDMYSQLTNFFAVKWLLKLYFLMKKIYLRLPI